MSFKLVNFDTAQRNTTCPAPTETHPKSRAWGNARRVFQHRWGVHLRILLEILFERGVRLLRSRQIACL